MNMDIKGSSEQLIWSSSGAIGLECTTTSSSGAWSENVLVMTDVFSKYTQAVPTHDQRAATVAKVLVSEWFCKFGVPGRIHSDQGRNFESHLIFVFIYLFIQFKITGTMHINRHFCKCASLAILANFQPQSLGRCDGKYKT